MLTAALANAKLRSWHNYRHGSFKLAGKPESAAKPPYISWTTFLNFIDWLVEVDIPVQVDRSFWSTKYAGGTGSQLMSGLRYLKLLDGEIPTASLEELVKADAEARKQLIGQLLKDRYPTVFAIELKRATPKLINDAFAALGVEGDTSRKAQSFFINACKFSDVPLAAGIRKRARNRRPATPRDQRASRKDESSNDPAQKASQVPSHDSADQSTTIELGGGGTLTLVLNANVMTLEEGDRQFISDLVGQFQAYERGEEGEETNED